MTAVSILEFFYPPCHNYSNSLKNLVEQVVSLPVVSMYMLVLHVVIKTPFESSHLF